jgi:hypothetical protein
MTDEEAIAHIEKIYRDHLEAQFPGGFEYIDKLSDSPMEWEGQLARAAIAINLLERTGDDPSPVASIAARQPESIPPGSLYTLLVIDPEDIDHSKLRTVLRHIADPSIHARFADDNIEMRPSEFLVALKEKEQ